MLRPILVVVTLVAALAAAVPAVATADDRPPASAETERSAHCPVCVAAGFTAIRVLKAAKTVRTAAKARTAVVAARAVAAARKAQASYEAAVRRASAEAGRLRRFTTKKLRDTWPTVKRETQACLLTSATLSGYKYFKDGRLDYDEYYNWYRSLPLTIFKTNPFPPGFADFPIYVGKDALGEPDEFAIGCGAGVAINKVFAGKIPTPSQ